MDMMTMQENNLKVQVDQYLKDNLKTYMMESNHHHEVGVLERIIRVEEELKHQREILEKLLHQIDKRFEQMDKRFEDLLHYMDKRFEQMDKRFEEMQKQVDKRFEEMQKQMDKRFEDLIHQMDKRFSTLQWIFGASFTLLTSGTFTMLGILLTRGV